MEDVNHWTEDGPEEIEVELVKDLKCCLVVPMVSGDKVIGVIGLQNFQQPNVFSRGDRDFLATLANHAAVAIDNAQLYDRIANELERRINELEAVNEFQQAISDISSVNDELQDIREAMSKIMDTDTMAIGLYNEDQGLIEFRLAYSGGHRVLDEDKVEGRTYGPRRFGVDRSLTEYVIRTGEPLLIEKDFDAWLEEHKDEVSSPLIGTTKCWLGVPMIAGDRKIGAIILQNEKPIKCSTKAIVTCWRPSPARRLLYWRMLDCMSKRSGELVSWRLSACFRKGSALLFRSINSLRSSTMQ